MKRLFQFKINKGVKASAVYTLANFFTKGINIITIPIFTRIMSTDQIGIVSTYNSWVSILSVIASLGLTTGSFSVAMHEFKTKRSEYESASLTLTSVFSAFFIFVYVLAFNEINAILGMPWQLVLLMLIGFFVQPATEFWMARQRFEYKYVICAIVSVLSATFSSALAIITVLLFDGRVFSQVSIARLYATYIVYDFIAIVLYIHIMKNGKVYFDKKYWKFGLTLSIPLMLHALSKHILDVSDKIMIQNLCGYSAAGIYGTLYSLSTLSLIFWNAINMSLVPYMFSCMDDKKNSYKKLNTIILSLMFSYGIIAIILALVSPEIVKIIATNDYYEAIYMMPPVAAGIYFTSLYCIMGNVLLYNKKTTNIMFATMIAAFLNIILNYIFINIFGYMAAAYTTLFCNIILAFTQYCMTKKIKAALPFDGKKIWTLSIAISCIVLSCNFLYSFNFIRYIIICIFLLAILIKRNFFINICKQILNKR